MQSPPTPGLHLWSGRLCVGPLQVQEMREAPTDGTTYTGEATGVRSHLKKSTKLS